MIASMPTQGKQKLEDSIAPVKAELELPIKPSQVIKGQVNLDDLSERDLDYGADERGLASLRQRLTHVIFKFNGAAPSADTSRIFGPIAGARRKNASELDEDALYTSVIEDSPCRTMVEV